MLNEATHLPRKPGTVRISLQDVLVWCYFIMTIIAGLAVFHGDSTLSSGQLRRMLAMVLMGCTILAWAVMLLIPKRLSLSLAVLIPVIYFLVINLNTYGTADWNMWSLARMIGFFLLPTVCKKQLYRYYRKFLVVMAAVGIAAYFSHLLSIPLPHRVVDYYGVLEAKYIDYTFSYLYYADGFTRLCGLFNEPGYLGTVMAFVLCIDRLNFKKKSNWILLIAGFCTFSMAFFVIIGAYFVAMCIKRPKLFALLSVVAVLYFFVLPNIEFKNEQVAHFVNRFTISDGAFSGDNRSNKYVDQTLTQMLASKDVWWGYGYGYSSEHFVSVGTFKTYVIDYGVLGFGLMYGALLLSAFWRARRSLYTIAFCICFTISIYQRAPVFTLLYFLLLFGGIQYMQEEISATEVTA